MANVGWKHPDADVHEIALVGWIFVEEGCAEVYGVASDGVIVTLGRIAETKAELRRGQWVDNHTLAYLTHFPTPDNW